MLICNYFFLLLKMESDLVIFEANTVIVAIITQADALRCV